MMIKPKFLINSFLVSVLLSTNLKFPNQDNPTTLISENKKANKMDMLLQEMKTLQQRRTDLKDEQYIETEYVIYGESINKKSLQTTEEDLIRNKKATILLQTEFDSEEEHRIITKGFFEDKMFDQAQLKNCITSFAESVKKLSYLLSPSMGSLLKSCELNHASRLEHFKQRIEDLNNDLNIILGKLSTKIKDDINKKEKIYIKSLLLCKSIFYISNEIISSILQTLNGHIPEKIPASDRKCLIGAVFTTSQTFAKLFKSFEQTFEGRTECFDRFLDSLTKLLENCIKKKFLYDETCFKDLFKEHLVLYDGSVKFIKLKIDSEKSKITAEKQAKEIEAIELKGKLAKIVATRSELASAIGERASRLDSQKSKKEKFYNTTEGQILIGLGSVAIFGAAGAAMAGLFPSVVAPALVDGVIAEGPAQLVVHTTRFALGGGAFGGCLAFGLIANANKKLNDSNKEISLLESRITKLTNELQISAKNEALWKRLSPETEADIAKKAKDLAEIEMIEKNINKMFVEVKDFIKKIDEELRKGEQK